MMMKDDDDRVNGYKRFAFNAAPIRRPTYVRYLNRNSKIEFIKKDPKRLTQNLELRFNTGHTLFKESDLELIISFGYDYILH